ncbi:NAD-dependent succinate-semialdehyde dehydrogenase [Paraburkholderia phytofirmans OLGA172]|uniref:NAD-dependent succinate-semialdehyde dehydrogenase n=1 Tax=Paraburkholderia phytofirmans OLGA172 TaxID=1417228 RepID=A0A160FQN0_9BURK|nr:NAD-dependent succinate-semialdehyde dehydrogenase [Paraburkholderia phytofirmans]ANB74984.1 NAD-dependent succinate-semialdehyde dehydrogenase [Paraburkholderia phytofirmans OLGA172]
MKEKVKLLDDSLLRDRAYVGGEWIQAVSGATFDVVNPATGELIGKAPHMAAVDVEHAIIQAEAAFGEWSARTAKEREAPLKEWARLIVANASDLAAILTLEQGKPLSDAKNEVLFAASFVEWFAEEAKRTYGEVIPGSRRNVTYVAIKEPVGVAAGITPWNLPCAMVTRKAAPALAAGCTMVLKPAEHTPFSALALCVLAERAGIPRGVLNVVTADRPAAEEIGRTLTSSHAVGKLSFTGSTAVGKRLAAQCADTMKRVSLELGGNSPFIVFADADLDVAVSSAVFAKFRNAGQTCIAPNRFLIDASVHDEFVKRMIAAIGELSLGDGFEPGVTLGPLISEDAVQKVERHVADALARGAKLLVGGKRADRKGNFFLPTLMTGISPEMAMSCEETFGPVMGLATFTSEDELLQRANGTRLGLASYMFSRDAARIHRTSRALQAGIVGVNTGAIATEVAPFGGFKESGIGREGARQGIDEFMETKFICEAFPG